MKTYIKKIIKSFLRSGSNKNILKWIRSWMDHDDSTIFLSSFRLDIRNQMEERKYGRIGKKTMLGCSMIFEKATGYISIGDNCFIGNSKLICINQITIGSYVTIAWNVTIYDHDSHSLNYVERRNDIDLQVSDYLNGRSFIHSKKWASVKSAPITIKDDAWIGMNSIILKGVTIGEGAVVAAGSVVVRDVPSWCVVAGNPAKIVKEIPPNQRYKLGEL